jgi:hypothetical protein
MIRPASNSARRFKREAERWCAARGLQNAKPSLLGCVNLHSMEDCAPRAQGTSTVMHSDGQTQRLSKARLS